MKHDRIDYLDALLWVSEIFKVKQLLSESKYLYIYLYPEQISRNYQMAEETRVESGKSV